MKLEQARRHALSLPESGEMPHFDYTSFRVRGRIFATAPPDGKLLNVFVGDEDRERALALHPEWVEKLWWGKKVVGVRVTLAKARPGMVMDLLTGAWKRKAPKALSAALG
jgi:hypothetical protein